MDTAKILADLKELTLALATGKASRQATVEELGKRIDSESIYKMKPDDPQADFITELFVSLEHLTEEGFAPSASEIQYFAECFEGKRTFCREDVRMFPIGDFQKDMPKTKNNRKNT